MVSTLKITKIQIPNSDSDVLSFNASTGIMTFHKDIKGENTNTTNLQQGLCKSWVFFDGSESPLTNNDSFNVSSLVDNGTGNYDKVFTNNMNSGNFSVSGTGADIIPISNNRDRNFEAVAENTTQVQINFFLSGQQDMNFVSCQSFGDLA